MKESMMHKMYQSQLDEKQAIWGENMIFKTLIQ